MLKKINIKLAVAAICSAAIALSSEQVIPVNYNQLRPAKPEFKCLGKASNSGFGTKRSKFKSRNKGKK